MTTRQGRFAVPAEALRRARALSVGAGVLLAAALASAVVLFGATQPWGVAVLVLLAVPAYGLALMALPGAAASAGADDDFVADLAATVGASAERLQQARADLCARTGDLDARAGELQAGVDAADAVAREASTAMGNEGPVAALTMSVQVLLSGLSGLLDDALRDKQEITDKLDGLMRFTSALQDRTKEVSDIAIDRKSVV